MTNMNIMTDRKDSSVVEVAEVAEGKFGGGQSGLGLLLEVGGVYVVELDGWSFG